MFQGVTGAITKTPLVLTPCLLAVARCCSTYAEGVQLSCIILNSPIMVSKTMRVFQKMSADPTRYHHEPKGFWKKFRDAVVINPEISSGLPIPRENRFIQPASRPEPYATPATMASDIAQNPYYKRDTRRAYPQTSVVDQAHLSSLLIASPAGQKAIAASSSTAVTKTEGTPELTSILANIPSAFVAKGVQTGSTSGLPPKPPTYKWRPQPGGDIPHAPDAYWPMIGYK